MFPLDPVYFIVALAIGLFYAYLMAPKPTVVVMYPTPDNAGKITYRDDAGVCYKYRVLETACPVDTNMIKQVPIQI